MNDQEVQIPNCNLCGKPLVGETRLGLKVTAHFECIFNEAYGKEPDPDDPWVE